MAQMALNLFKATSMILCALLFCMEFSPVVAQTPTASPLTAPAPQIPPPVPQHPLVPPVAAEAPPQVAAEPVPGVLQPQPQVTNMIEALRDAGQFGAIAGLLDGLQMKSLTPMTTWLLPNDNAFSGTNYPKNVTKFLDYHVIRELLPFSRLLTLSAGTRIPTFLGSETCVVTNNHQFNFSINNAMVLVPDLYSDTTVAVHGLNAILDDASFNGIPLPPALLPPPMQSRAPVPSDAPATSGSSPSPLPLSPFPSSAQPIPTLNITFPNAASGFSSSGICMTVATASVSILVFMALF